MALGPVEQPGMEQTDANPIPKLSKGVVLGPDGKPLVPSSRCASSTHSSSMLGTHILIIGYNADAVLAPTYPPSSP